MDQVPSNKALARKATYLLLKGTQSNEMPVEDLFSLVLFPVQGLVVCSKLLTLLRDARKRFRKAIISRIQEFGMGQEKGERYPLASMHQAKRPVQISTPSLSNPANMLQPERRPSCKPLAAQ